MVNICDDIIKNSLKLVDRYFGMDVRNALVMIMSRDNHKSLINMLPTDIIHYILKFIYHIIL